MSIFDGLHLYEVVLAILGTILFFVLVVILIVTVVRNGSIKPLLLFFIVPILMIGFPAWSKIKWNKDGFELEKTTKALVANPSNIELKTKLKDLVQDVKPRASESQDGLVKVARAQAVLGHQEKAENTLNQALTANPQSAIAKDLKTRLDAVPASNDSALREAVAANIVATTSDRK